MPHVWLPWTRAVASTAAPGPCMLACRVHEWLARQVACYQRAGGVAQGGARGTAAAAHVSGRPFEARHAAPPHLATPPHPTPTSVHDALRTATHAA